MSNYYGYDIAKIAGAVTRASEAFVEMARKPHKPQIVPLVIMVPQQTDADNYRQFAETLADALKAAFDG